MTRVRRWLAWGGAAAALAACAPSQTEAPSKNVLVVGIDVSGSFGRHYDDAIEFAALYLYGHLNGLGNLPKPSALFVGSVGGVDPGDVKAFHPIHDFEGKNADQIAQDLREWFPRRDRLTDFNAFFDRVGTLIRRQNLVLAPLNIVLLSDGVPDDALPASADSVSAVGRLDVSPLEFLSRSVTVRLLYPSPTIAVAWEREMPRNRVRLWTLDAEIAEGWRAQVEPGAAPEAQERLWRWIADNVNFRVRSRIL
jgi:hypothetical protein